MTLRDAVDERRCIAHCRERSLAAFKVPVHDPRARRRSRARATGKLQRRVVAAERGSSSGEVRRPRRRGDRRLRRRGARPGRRRRHADRARRAPARRCGDHGVRVSRRARRLRRRRRRRPTSSTAVADADVVFVALKAYSLPAIAPAARRAAAARRGDDLGAERHPVVVLPAHDGPLDGLVLESVDPGGVISRVDPRRERRSAASSTARPRSSRPA